jgi:uncharacterized iron-regulated membrane protein
MVIVIIAVAVSVVVVALAIAGVVARWWERRKTRRRQSDPGNMTEDEVAALIDNHAW